MPSSPGTPFLDWLFTTGTSGNDAGAAVGVDIAGHVYATGWKVGQAATRDLWVCKIEQPLGSFCEGHETTTCAWTGAAGGLLYSGTGDDAGLGLVVDGIDRVYITGQFANTIDFDPSTAASDNQTSAGGLDLFVTRLVHPTETIPNSPVQYDGTFRIGSTYDEVGTAIAIEGLRSLRLAHVGWFGAPNSPNGYTVDFDPGSGTANKSGNGNADAFVNSFVPTIPTDVKAALSIVFDGSESTEPDHVPMLQPLRDHIHDATFSYPFVRPIVPRDATVALSACWFGHIFESPEGGPIPYLPTGKTGDQILPWTVIRPNSAQVFARRLRNQPRYRVQEPRQAMSDGFRAALASQYGDGISACYNSVMVVADGGHFPVYAEGPPLFWGNIYNPDEANRIAQIRDARDDLMAAFNPAPDTVEVNQINGIAVQGDPLQGGWNRAYLWNNVVESDADVTGTNPPQPYGLGLGVETVLDPFFLQFTHASYATGVRQVLARSVRCPADLNRDGAIDSFDLEAFTVLTMALDPIADLNGDEQWNGNDGIVFNRAYQLGCCP